MQLANIIYGAEGSPLNFFNLFDIVGIHFYSVFDVYQEN